MLMKDENSAVNAETMKRKLEQEYANIVEEHRTLKKERSEMLKQTERIKIEKEKLEDAIIDMERKFKKVIQDFELTNSLLTEEKQKNATLISTINRI